MGRRLDLTGKQIIDFGTCAEIYLIGDKVVKVNSSVFRKNFTQKEYAVQKDLYEMGINVPKPYGIIRVLDMDGVKNFGLIMEYIEGKTFREVFLTDTDLSNKVYKKIIREDNKAKSLGFKLKDRHKGNAIVNQTGKAFLIDFGGNCESPKTLEGVAS